MKRHPALFDDIDQGFDQKSDRIPVDNQISVKVHNIYSIIYIHPAIYIPDVI